MNAIEYLNISVEEMTAEEVILTMPIRDEIKQTSTRTILLKQPKVRCVPSRHQSSLVVKFKLGASTPTSWKPIN